MRNLMPRTGLRPDKRLGHQSVDSSSLLGAVHHPQLDLAISLTIVTTDDVASLPFSAVYGAA
jgi:hypothetical protein